MACSHGRDREVKGENRGCLTSYTEAVIATARDLTVAGKAVDADAVMSGVAERLGVSSRVVGALAVGVDAMGEYALAALDDDVDAIGEEDAAVTASRRAFRPLLEARLQERVDQIDDQWKRGSVCPACGAAGNSVGRRRRAWVSAFGAVSLVRRWSDCTQEKGGWSVAQKRLLLPDGDYTPRLDEMMTMLAAVTTHEGACKLCEGLLGVTVSEHAIQDAVERRGEALVRLDDVDAARFIPWEANGLPRATKRPTAAVEKAPNVAYLEVDGVLPMTRQLDGERSQPVEGHRGGKGLRYKMEGKEVKNAVLYTDAACAEEGDGRGVVLEKKYVSSLGHWLGFAALLWMTMLTLRFDQASVLVILSDGAHWIRELAKWLPCRPVLILDLFHAKHRVWEVANAVFREKTPEARLWANTQCTFIERGEVWEVLSALGELRPRRKATRKVVESLVTYLTNNKDRMNYPEYRAKGYRVSSGSVESANYHVTGARLKQQGMRWSEKGAAEMARLRADLANDVWRKRTLQVLAA